MYSSAMSISIEDALAEYVEWRKAQGFARATISNDKSAIRMMMAALSADCPVAHIDDQDMVTVLDHAATTRSAASINMVQSSLSAFFRWCRIRKYMTPDSDPLLGIRYRKVPKKERKRLVTHEFAAFLDCAEQPRDRMALALGLYLFLRSSEITYLRLRDVDLDAGTIGVTIHKTKDYDIMPISRELDRELRKWLSVYQEECGPLDKDWFIVPAKTQAGWGRHALNPPARISRPEEIVKRTLKAYGWTDTHWQGFHLLRASGAREWFEALNDQTIDGALKIVQAHLHHQSVTMTEKYLGLTADRVKRDRIIKGETMFPSAATDNVIHLRGIG